MSSGRFRRVSSALVALVALVALCSLAGCSSDEAEPTAPCNDLVNEGPEVIPELKTAGTTPMGGTIEDGRYVQTALDYYPDSGMTVPTDPYTRSGTFELEAGVFQAVVRKSIGDQSETQRFLASYETSGTVLTLAYVCPELGLVERPSYTATPTELRLYYRVSNERGTAEIILTKQ